MTLPNQEEIQRQHQHFAEWAFAKWAGDKLMNVKAMSAREKVTREQHAALIAASNLLCEFVGRHLPDGWEISLNMRHGEADLSLTDTSGEEIEIDSADHGISSIADMCYTAWEIETQPYKEA